ncbi:MAG: helix-turn-helix domain-containing protein [Paludibacter sp.]
MTNLIELLMGEGNFTVSMQKNDLIDYGKFLISQTKKELEAELIASQSESYKTRLETCDFLKVDQSTLHRWAKRGYLMPIEMGGRRLYKMSDLKRILNGGK